MHILYSKIGRLAILGIFIFLAFVIFKQFSSAYQNNSQLRALEKSILELHEENEAIKKETALSDDPNIIEREARAQLNLKKEGEHVVIIIPSGNEDFQDELHENSTEPEGQSIWRKIMSLLGLKH